MEVGGAVGLPFCLESPGAQGVQNKFIPMDTHLLGQQILIECLLHFCCRSEICGCTTNLTPLVFWWAEHRWTTMPSNEEGYQDQRIEEGGGYFCTSRWSRKPRLFNQLWLSLVDGEDLSPEEISIPGGWAGTWLVSSRDSQEVSDARATWGGKN